MDRKVRHWYITSSFSMPSYVLIHFDRPYKKRLCGNWMFTCDDHSGLVWRDAAARLVGRKNLPRHGSNTIITLNMSVDEIRVDESNLRRRKRRRLRKS